MGTKMVLKASYISIATNDLSAYCSKIEIAAQVEEKDVTTFASGGWKEEVGGLFSAGVSLTFFQSVTATEIDSIIWPLFIAGVPVAFESRTSNGSRSTSNPSWTGNLLISKWSPISGAVGDVDGVDVQWNTSGAMSRLTA